MYRSDLFHYGKFFPILNGKNGKIYKWIYVLCYFKFFHNRRNPSGHNFIEFANMTCSIVLHRNDIYSTLFVDMYEH